MTIGIGVLCDDARCLVLASDTRGSYGDLTPLLGSHNWVGKQFDFYPSFNVYACIAGVVSDCQSFVSELHEQIKQIPKKKTQLEHFVRAISEAQWHSWEPIVSHALRFNLAVTRQEWIDRKDMNTTLYRAGRKLIQRTDLPVDFILGGFIGEQRPLLMRMSGKYRIEEEVNFTLVGTGAPYSLAQFNQRGQNVHMSFQRSVLHVAEALEEAKKDKDVGEAADYVVVTAKGPQRFMAHNPTLTKWMRDYATKSTEDLDGNSAARLEVMRYLYKYESPHAFKQSASRKSKRAK